MNFNNYTRVQLGIPRASPEAGIAAVRRARVMQMNGFGAMAISQVTGKPCSAGDYSSNWEGYCDCLFKPGSGPMQVCCGKDNLNPDGSCGKPKGSCASKPLDFLSRTANTSFCFAPWTVPGKGERASAASGFSQQILNQFQQTVDGTYTGGGGGGGGGGTGGGSDTIEEKKDNTMLFVGLGVAAVAVLALSMRK